MMRPRCRHAIINFIGFPHQEAKMESSSQNNVLMVIGGIDDSQCTNECEIYSRHPNNKKLWDMGPYLNQAKGDHSVCRFMSNFTNKQLLYSFGGYLIKAPQKFSSVIEKLEIIDFPNFETWKWEIVKIGNFQNIIQGCRMGTIQLDEQNIMIFGGSNQNGFLTSVKSLNIITGECVEEKALPICDDFFGNEVKKVDEYMVGFGCFYRKIYTYHLNKKSWMVHKYYAPQD